MAEISTVAVITAKPESAEELLAILTTLAEATHGESGCLRYSLQRGLQDPSVFVTIEKWDSSEDLKAHLGSEHIRDAMTQAGPLLASPPLIVSAVPTGAGDAAKNAF